MKQLGTYLSIINFTYHLSIPIKSKNCVFVHIYKFRYAQRMYIGMAIQAVTLLVKTVYLLLKYFPLFAMCEKIIAS